MSKKKLLLHICCIGCGVYVCKKLAQDYDLTLYFYNPNIWPEEEYKKRLEEIAKITRQENLKLIIGEYNHQDWLKQVRHLALEPEGGVRCEICYRIRLEDAVKKAKELSCDIFATTLTISPHKDADKINRIGLELANEYHVKYMESDWKKDGGFSESCKLSRELDLYRQNYCGCEYSLNT